MKIVTFDLADWSRVAEAMRKVRDCHGPVDIVINNAGIGSRGFACDSSLDVDVAVMNVNYFGQVAVTKGNTATFIQFSPERDYVTFGLCYCKSICHL